MLFPAAEPLHVVEHDELHSAEHVDEQALQGEDSAVPLHDPSHEKPHEL